jgi:hypothetical protein
VLSRTGADLIGRDELGRPIERVRVDVGDGASARTIAVPVDELHLPPGRRARLMTRAAGFTSSDSQSHAVGVGELVAHYLLSWSNVLWPAWRDTGDGSDWKRRFAERKADVLTYLEAWRERAREVDRRGPGSTFRTNLADRVRRLDGAALIPSRLRLIEAWARRPAAEWAQPPPLPASDTEAQTRLADWWSFWGAAAPTPTVAPVDEARHARELTQLRASPAADLEALANLLTPAWFAGCEHYKLAFDHGLPAGGPPELVAIELESDSVVGRLRQLRRFYEGLPYVRRALANVSCLMMFDDHEVTDDWNISMAWVARTGAKALGRDTIANALVAYGLCQDWGNLPARYAPVEPPAGEPRREQPHERLLRLAQALFRDGDRPRPAGPTVDARSQLEALFGLGVHEAPQLDWHWSLTDPSAAPYEILSIDNRTRRGYETREGSPSAVSRESLPAQLPTTGPAGSELTIVIAPLPPIGFAPIEELIQPIVNLIEEYRADPRFAEWRPRQDFPDVQVDYAYGRLGRDPEPWSLRAALLRGAPRPLVVAPRGRVPVGRRPLRVLGAAHLLEGRRRWAGGEHALRAAHLERPPEPARRTRDVAHPHGRRAAVRIHLHRPLRSPRVGARRRERHAVRPRPGVAASAPAPRARARSWSRRGPCPTTSSRISTSAGGRARRSGRGASPSRRTCGPTRCATGSFRRSATAGSCRPPTSWRATCRSGCAGSSTTTPGTRPTARPAGCCSCRTSGSCGSPRRRSSP